MVNTRAVVRPASSSAAPVSALPARRFSHVRDGFAVSSCGLVGFGVGSVSGHPGWGVAALAGGVAGAGVVTASGARRARRAELADRTLEALTPLLGVRQPDRRLMRMSKWTSGWPGVPRRVRLRYAPGAPDQDAGWRQQLLATLAGRLLARYRVVRHDQRRCTIWLALVPPGDGGPSTPPPAQVRAERAITELIGPTAKVTSVAFEGDGLSEIVVAHQAGARLAASGYRARVERVISTMMPGRWRAVWDLEADTVRFEVRPALPSSVWLPVPDLPDGDDLLKDYRSVKIPYAIDEDGTEICWYPARVPHMMLTGGTGTGKTSSAHAILGQITRRGWPVWVLDAKRVEFLDFRVWPNVQIVAGTIPQQVALVHRLWELMEHRYALIEAGHATVNDFEPLIAFLDEYADFRSNLLEWYAGVRVTGKGGDPTRPPTLAEVASLLRKARTARIHLILSTQRPDAEFLGGEARDNLGQRMSMGRLSPQGAMMMWENPAVGVSLPRACTGRAVSTTEAGRPVEVQAYRFPDLYAESGSQEAALLEAIRPTESRHPRLVIVAPQPDTNDKGEVTEPTFRDYAHAEWALAADRPDLDPLTGDREGVGQGRALSSTLAALGLAGGVTTGPVPRLLTVPADPIGDPETEEPAADQAAADDDYLGYGEPVNVNPYQVSVGDLVEVAEGSGIWAVVDEEPLEDVVELGMVAISWRGDGDESGSLSVPEDFVVSVRRPQDDLL